MLGPRAAAWRLTDGRCGYGWISIGLHWTTAALVLALLFVGDSINAPGGGAMVAVHTSIAVSFYALLAARIFWRLIVGHPGPSPAQKPRAFHLGKLAHFLLLGALGLMLVSGPVMAWSGSIALRLFGLFRLPNPVGLHPDLHEALLRLHGYGAAVLAFGVALHVLGVFKHMLIDRDETFARMMIAGEHDARAADDRPPSTITP